MAGLRVRRPLSGVPLSRSVPVAARPVRLVPVRVLPTELTELTELTGVWCSGGVGR